MAHSPKFPVYLRAIAFLAGLTLSFQAHTASTDDVELALQIGHSDAVLFVDFVDDDSRVVSLSGDGTALVWDIETGKEIRNAGRVREPSSVHGAIHHGLRRFYAADIWGVNEFDLDSGELLRTFNASTKKVKNMNLGGRVIGSVGAMSLQGDQLMIVDPVHQFAKIWNVREEGTEGRATAIAHTNLFNVKEEGAEQILDAELSLDGERLLIARGDEEMRITNVKRGKVERSFGGENKQRNGGFMMGALNAATGGLSGAVQDIASIATDLSEMFSGRWYSALRVRWLDEKTFIAGHLNGDVVIWKRTGGRKRAYTDLHEEAVTDIHLGASGTLLYTTSVDGTAKSWDISGKKPKPLVTFEGHDGAVLSAALSDSGRYLLTGGMDQTVILWETKTGQEVRRFSSVGVTVSEAVYGADAATVYTGFFGDSLIRRWNLATGEVEQTYRDNGPGVFQIDVSPDGRYLGIASLDGTGRIWKADSGEAVLEVRQTGESMPGIFNEIGINTASFETSRDPDGMRSIAWFPDSRRFATVGRGKGTVKVWDVESGDLLRESRKGYDLSGALAVSPGPREQIAYGVSIGGQGLAATYTNDPVQRGAYGRVVLWDMEEDKNQDLGAFAGILGRQPTKPRHPHGGGVFRTGFSADGEMVLTASGDMFGNVWSPAKDERAAFLRGHRGRVADIAASADGRRIATASYDGSVRLWSGKDYSEIAVLDSHGGKVYSVDFAPDSRTLVSASTDGTARVWSADDGEEIARLIAVDDDEWVIATPDNYYMGSKSAMARVAFKVGGETYPFEQFDLRLNRPDIVLERLGYADQQEIAVLRAAYQKRLDKMGLNETDLAQTFELPTIEVRYGGAASSIQRELNVYIEAQAASVDLDRLEVLVNDVPIHGTDGIPVNGPKYLGELQIQLGNGRNKIQIAALDENGTSSLKRTFEVTYTGASAPRRLHVVAIGVSDYLDESITDLTYPSKDARDLSNVLSQRSDEFDDIVVHELIDGAATREAILAMREVLMKSSVDDQVVVFIAGHGLLDQDLNYYFATHDMRLDNIAATGVSYSDIENLLDGIPAREKLLMMDTCFAGETDSGTMDIEDVIVVAESPDPGLSASRSLSAGRRAQLQTSFELMQSLFVNLKRGSGTVVIAAAAGDQYALENAQWRNGVFTYGVLNGLQDAKADKNGDGRVQVTELKEYVDKTVTELTYGEQTPTTRRQNVEFDYVLQDSRGG